MWKENPEFYQYLSKLGGFDVDQLSKAAFLVIFIFLIIKNSFFTFYILYNFCFFFFFR